METLTQICYMILAPLSVASELILIYGFWRLNQHKNHPEVLIFWQCLAQIILDIHWFTGIEGFHSSLSKFECLCLGAFSVYFYFLSWNYILILAIEILLKILYPVKTGYKKRRIWYHILAHLSSLIIFIIIVISGTNGQSVMKTCFVEHQSIYELFVGFPIILHFPLCIGITLYALYISTGTYIIHYLNYHLLVVLIFSISWLPIAMIHSLNYKGFGVNIPLWAIYISTILGAPSGLFVFIARMMQRGLLKKIIMSVFSPASIKGELLVQLNAPKSLRLDSKDLSYSEFFDKLTTEVCNIQRTKVILNVLQTVMEGSINPEIVGQENREWKLSASGSSKPIKIIQHNITTFEKIMKNSNIWYSDISQSLSSDEDFEGFEERIKFNMENKSFVYYTKNMEFIIKSITSKELMCLNSMIIEYSNQICSPDGSYLEKIFGLFKLRFENSKAIRIIIIENLGSRLSNPIKFSLNGYLGPKISSLQTNIHDINDLSREIIHNDQDLIETIGCFNINSVDLLSIITRIKRDTTLLRKNLILEYNLLVLTKQSLSLKSTIIDRKFVTSNENLVIFIGIDNLLQVFDIKNKMTKSEARHSDKYFGIDEYSPKSYRKRFLYMVKSIFKAQTIN